MIIITQPIYNQGSRAVLEFKDGLNNNKKKNNNNNKTTIYKAQ